MMRARPRLLLIALGLAVLSGCGTRKDLHPAKGDTLPPTPYGAVSQPGPGDLLKPPPQARPSRSDEALKDSKPRDADPYDLPPTR